MGAPWLCICVWKGAELRRPVSGQLARVGVWDVEAEALAGFCQPHPPHGHNPLLPLACPAMQDPHARSSSSYMVHVVLIAHRSTNANLFFGAKHDAKIH